MAKNFSNGKSSFLSAIIQFCSKIQLKVAFGTFLVIAVIWNLYRFLGDQEHHVILGADDKLTVVVNTFMRHEMMEESVNYYAKCPVVKYISVVWSEPQAPPEDLVRKFELFRNVKVKISSCKKK